MTLFVYIEPGGANKIKHTCRPILAIAVHGIMLGISRKLIDVILDS